LSALRFDAGKLGKAQRTPQGGARIPAALTRVGVLAYRREDGTIQRELRPPEEVFSAESLASLRDAPVTVGHAAVVTAANWKQHSVGYARDGRQDGDKVAGELVVQDASVLPRIDTGELGDLSMGYSVREDRTPGEWNGQPYDLVQRDIRYNHVALLPPGQGRAGRECALRLDSSAAVLVDDSAPASTGNQSEMTLPVKLIRIDNKEYTYGSEEHVNAAVAIEKSRADKAEARADAAETKVKELETKVAELSDPTRFDARVAELAALRTKATAVLGADYKFDGKTDADVMRDAILKVAPNTKLEGKSADYVAARFDAIEVTATTSSAPRADAADVLDPSKQTQRTDSAEPDAEKARLEMNKRNANAWKNPSGEK
jgi:uncharacterized protein